MKKIIKYYVFLIITSTLLIASTKYLYCLSSITIDTEYKLRGLSYPNLDYNISTSTDARAYYYQQLHLTLKGNFLPETEICTKIQAIGIVGSTVTLSDFEWQKKYPYPNTNFIPFIENAYIKVRNFAEYPVEFTIGRQPLEYGGGGLLISDNGAGMNAIHIAVDYPKQLHAELFTVKVKENFIQSQDNDIYGLCAKYPFKKFKLEFGYYDQKDFSGTPYRQGIKVANTISITKQFYDFRIFNSGGWGNYFIEYVLQKGRITPAFGNNVEMNARAVLLKGRLINEKTKLGKVSGFGLLTASTGNKKIGFTPSGENEWHSTDEEFNPDFTKKYDGLIRSGWGAFFASNVVDTFFDIPTDKTQNIPNFSGLGTFGLGMDFSPWFGWTFGFSGFYYNAGTSFNKGAPAISGGFAASGSGIETLSALLISEDPATAKRYNLGAELDIFALYVPSKLLEFKISYSRYTPPSFSFIWPKINSNEQFLFEMACRF